MGKIKPRGTYVNFKSILESQYGWLVGFSDISNF